MSKRLLRQFVRLPAFRLNSPDILQKTIIKCKFLLNKMNIDLSIWTKIEKCKKKIQQT